MTVYFGLCFCPRMRLLKVFGRPLRTISLIAVLLYCVVLLYAICLSVHLTALFGE